MRHICLGNGALVPLRSDRDSQWYCSLSRGGSKEALRISLRLSFLESGLRRGAHLPPVSGRVSSDACLSYRISAEAEQAAMSFWTCSFCTFVSGASFDKCEMCEQLRKPATTSSSRTMSSCMSSLKAQQENTSKWGCRACTFLNKDSDNICDICGTPRSSISLDTFAEIDPALDEEGGVEKHSQPSSNFVPPSSTVKKRKHLEDSDSAIAMGSYGSTSTVSNAVLGKLHLEKLQRQKQGEEDNNQGSFSLPSLRSLASDTTPARNDNLSLVILTYNVWFREDLQLVERMNAIGAIICEQTPHLICFQEVTPAIYDLFQGASWWGQYKCSVTPTLATKRAYFCILLSRVDSTIFHTKAYSNTIMGRELCIAEMVASGGKKLFVATTHLESPCPAPPTWNQMFSSERVIQAKEALNALKGYQNVVLGGDMNWDDKLDGRPPLPDGWYDAWLTLRPHEEGLTYDSKENPMLSGSRLRKRLDRVFCHLEDYHLESIERVGTTPIPGVTFEKEMKVKKQTQRVKLPVLPSDHFGLLLKLRQQ